MSFEIKLYVRKMLGESGSRDCALGESWCVKTNLKKVEGVKMVVNKRWTTGLHMTLYLPDLTDVLP